MSSWSAWNSRVMSLLTDPCSSSPLVKNYVARPLVSAFMWGLCLCLYLSLLVKTMKTSSLICSCSYTKSMNSSWVTFLGQVIYLILRPYWWSFLRRETFVLPNFPVCSRRFPLEGTIWNTFLVRCQGLDPWPAFGLLVTRENIGSLWDSVIPARTSLMLSKPSALNIKKD